MTTFKERYLAESEAQNDSQSAAPPTAAETVWAAENVELVTVGIDVGSSTSHLMFARVHMQRLATGLSSRFAVVGREVIWRSPILLTPYLIDENTIDIAVLGAFIDDAFKAAGLSREQIDSGAVILTGAALKRSNAEAIAHLFAAESGKFVCASAGHHLECVMAAHGAGTVALWRQRKKVMMNIDIGGGTTKLALVQNGAILATAALEVGGRLVAFDEARIISRIEEPALRHAVRAGVTLERGKAVGAEEVARLAEAEVAALVEAVLQGELSDHVRRLFVTPPLPHDPKPEAITFSGGVGEFILSRETGEHGDLGGALGTAVRCALDDGRIPYPVESGGEAIRATVIGASQFSVEVSGNTIWISDKRALPLRNVPVVYPTVDLSDGVNSGALAREIGRALARFDLVEGAQPVALAFRWLGEPSHARLKALAEGIVQGMPTTVAQKGPLILIFDEDIGRSLGFVLSNECRVGGDILSIDGADLKEFDFIDIGQVIEPTDVVPLVIKSLLFPAADF